jgi:lipoprotein-releasing system permease protein
MLVYFMSKKKINDSTMRSTTYIDYEPRVKDFYVRGIFNTGFSDIDKNLVFVDLKQIQTLNYWKSNEVAGYEVFLKNFDFLEQSLEDVNDKVGYNYTVSSAKQLQSSIFSWLEMIDVNAVVIITLMVLVAAINMISALLILILERTNMIGLLKAFGSSKQAIRTIFFHVSLQLLLKGLIIGNLIGIGFCFIQYFFNVIPLNPATYYLDSVPINLSLGHVLYVNLGTIVTCMIMLFLPTLILNKISPIKAIQFS